MQSVRLSSRQLGEQRVLDFSPLPDTLDNKARVLSEVLLTLVMLEDLCL